MRTAPPNSEEINYAFRLWYFKNFKFKLEDRIIESFLDINIEAQPKSWLKVARQAMHKSALAVAKEMKITPRAYAKHEIGEENKTITLAKLMEAAEALDCEFVYGIRPKTRKKFSTLIWERTLPRALQHPWLTKCDQKRKGHALYYIATQLIKNPKFRREQNWSQHKN